MQCFRRRDTGRGAFPRVRAAAAGLVLLLALPGGVLADATLIASTPADGATLTTIPAEAVLTFDHALTDASSFVVLDASGTTVATGAKDPADATAMRAALPALAAGPYEVQWTAGSGDGHIVRGTFAFTVSEPTPPPATATPIPTETPSTTPAPSTAPAEPEPTATPAPSADGNLVADGGVDVLLPILAVAVLIGGGLLVMLRRRGTA